MQKGVLQNSLHWGLQWQRKAHCAPGSACNTKGIWAASCHLKNTIPCSQQQLLLSSTSAAGAESAQSPTGFEANTAQVVLVTHF